MMIESSAAIEPRSDRGPRESEPAPLSLDRVVATLQVMLATRRAARNADRAHGVARDL